MLSVPLPRTLCSIIYSCSDTNKGSMMPVLLWVSCGFLQYLTQSATLDLLKMPFTNAWTWPSFKNAAVGDHRNLWCDTKRCRKTLEESSLSGISTALSCHRCPLGQKTRPPSPVTQCGNTGLFLSLRTVSSSFNTGPPGLSTSDSRYRFG